MRPIERWLAVVRRGRWWRRVVRLSRRGQQRLHYVWIVSKCLRSAVVGECRDGFYGTEANLDFYRVSFLPGRLQQHRQAVLHREGTERSAKIHSPHDARPPVTPLRRLATRIGSRSASERKLVALPLQRLFQIPIQKVGQR